MTSKERLKEIADEIVRRVTEEQRQINDFMGPGKNWDEFDDTDLRHNTRWLKDVIDEIGWPTIPKVGSRASLESWLIVQHSDYDVEFQQKCLELMRKVDKDHIKQRHIAYLDDRIRVKKGMPQRYGTQLRPEDSEPFPIERPKTVDARRKNLGMKPLSEYIKESKRIYEK